MIGGVIERTTLWVASWILAVDGRTHGLIATLGPAITRWSEARMVERAAQIRATRAAVTPTAPAVLGRADAACTPAPIAPVSRSGPSCPCTRIVEVLGSAAPVGIFEGDHQIVLDVTVGIPPMRRYITRDERDRLEAAGVTVLPWASILSLRASVHTTPGVA